MPDERIETMTNADRDRLLRRARWLETITILYNVIEAGLTISVGLMKGSSALVSFGLDAAVEAVSAAMLLWRITSEERGVDQGTLRSRKKMGSSVSRCQSRGFSVFRGGRAGDMFGVERLMRI